MDLGGRIFGASQGAPTAQQQLELVQAELVRVTAERDALLEAAKKAGQQQSEAPKSPPDSATSH